MVQTIFLLEITSAPKQEEQSKHAVTQPDTQLFSFLVLAEDTKDENSPRAELTIVIIKAGIFRCGPRYL